MATKSRKYQNQKILRTLLIALIVLAVIGVGVTLLQNAGKKNDGVKDSANLTGTHYVAIDVAGHGTITAELYADTAPITVENFMHLVDEKFYDGLTFHRIIAGFMMQGGCPLGTGTGGADKDIKGEFSQNGIPNAIKHEKGVLSMARSALPNSASSQFFIMHQAAPYLDGSYAAFGRVTEGLDVVDAVCENAVGGDGNGVLPKANQPVIRSIRCTAVQ